MNIKLNFNLKGKFEINLTGIIKIGIRKLKPALGWLSQLAAKTLRGVFISAILSVCPIQPPSSTESEGGVMKTPAQTDKIELHNKLTH